MKRLTLLQDSSIIFLASKPMTQVYPSLKRYIVVAFVKVVKFNCRALGYLHSPKLEKIKQKHQPVIKIQEFQKTCTIIAFSTGTDSI